MIADARSAFDSDGLIDQLKKALAERALNAEMDHHLVFERFYVTAFVSPATGESFWYLATGVSQELFEGTLALFAREAGAGRDRIIVLVLDGAG